MPTWKLDEFQNAGPLPQSPVLQSPVQSSEKLEDLTLIPYGAAKLRITVFPILEKSLRRLNLDPSSVRVCEPDAGRPCSHPVSSGAASAWRDVAS